MERVFSSCQTKQLVGFRFVVEETSRRRRRWRSVVGIALLFLEEWRRTSTPPARAIAASGAEVGLGSGRASSIFSFNLGNDLITATETTGNMKYGSWWNSIERWSDKVISISISLLNDRKRSTTYLLECVLTWNRITTSVLFDFALHRSNHRRQLLHNVVVTSQVATAWISAVDLSI